MLALVCLCLACVAPLSACSSPHNPTKSELVANLGILKSAQYGFSDAQVRCVASKAEAELHGKDLRQFGKDLVVLSAQHSTAGMAPKSLKTFTDAISACAV